MELLSINIQAFMLQYFFAITFKNRSLDGDLRFKNTRGIDHHQLPMTDLLANYAKRLSAKKV